MGNIDFSASKEKKQSEMEPVYRLDKDLSTVLHQIVKDLSDKENSEIRNKWGVSFKEMSWCNLRLGGDALELKVEKLDGSLREPVMQVAEIRKKLKETETLLGKFEKAVKKEFKERTGKTLSFVGKGKTGSDHGLVALNGLYRFVAYKRAIIKTSLDGQSFENDD